MSRGGSWCSEEILRPRLAARVPERGGDSVKVTVVVGAAARKGWCKHPPIRDVHAKVLEHDWRERVDPCLLHLGRIPNVYGRVQTQYRREASC